MKTLGRKLLLALLLTGAVGIFAGCGTDDPNNLSTMPWDKAAPWEGPMPSNINQGR